MLKQYFRHTYLLYIEPNIALMRYFSCNLAIVCLLGCFLSFSFCISAL